MFEIKLNVPYTYISPYERGVSRIVVLIRRHKSNNWLYDKDGGSWSQEFIWENFKRPEVEVVKEILSRYGD